MRRLGWLALVPLLPLSPATSAPRYPIDLVGDLYEDDLGVSYRQEIRLFADFTFVERVYDAHGWFEPNFASQYLDLVYEDSILIEEASGRRISNQPCFQGTWVGPYAGGHFELCKR